jgi:hypothetical protein
MRGGGYGSTIVSFVLLLVVLYVLYTLYNLAYGNSKGSTTQIGVKNMPMGTVSMNGTNAYLKKLDNNISASTYVAKQALTGFTDAGQYSITMWVYVIDSKGAGNSNLVNLLEINTGNRFASTDKGKTILYVGLNPKNAALVIRQSTMGGPDTEQLIDNTLTPGLDPSGNRFPLSELVSNYNSGSKFTGNDRCDIVNGIEYQRWVQISVVANGRTLDVYIDGKLARSCVYKAGYLGGNGTATSYVGMGNNDKLKGYFSNITYYKNALSPDQVWNTYQEGPTGPFDIWAWLYSIFNVSVSIKSDGLNAMNPYASCPSS